MQPQYIIKEEVGTPPNSSVLKGYFYLRLLSSGGSYLPKLGDLMSLAFRFLLLPTQVFKLYEDVLSKFDC